MWCTINIQRTVPSGLQMTEGVSMMSYGLRTSASSAEIQSSLDFGRPLDLLIDISSSKPKLSCVYCVENAPLYAKETERRG